MTIKEMRRDISGNISKLNERDMYAVWSLMNALLNPPEKKQESQEEKILRASQRIGIAKGKIKYPDDIDFCNEEIAEMFGV